MKNSKKTKPFILSDKILSSEILSQYNLEAAQIETVKFKDTNKQRAVFKITYKTQSFCLKKIYFDSSNLLFVYSALEWLWKNNINVPKLLNTKSGEKFVIFNDMIFILTIWIDGIKCTLDNYDHLFSAIKQLAYIHKSSRNFFPIKESKFRKGLSNNYISTKKHFENLLNLYNDSQNLSDEFSKKFLAHFYENLEIAKTSLEISYRVNRNYLSTSLCHGDYVTKNLLFDNNSNIWIIDFDKCKFDYSMTDLGYFLRRFLRRDFVNWNVDLTLALLREYNNISPFTPDDLRYLISYICFPQKFWKTSKDYFNVDLKINKDELLMSLEKSTAKLENHSYFSKEILSRIMCEYNINL